MKTVTLFFILSFSTVASAQFSGGNRMTNDPKDQYLSYNNAYNLAASGEVIHLVYNDKAGTDAEISYLRSEDGGVTWTNRIALTADDGFYSGFPSVASWYDQVHVVWGDHKGGNGDIYYSRSANGGHSWTNEVKLTGQTGNSLFPSLSTSGPVLHLIWQDDKYGNNEILYRRSINSGLSWGNEIRLTNNAGDSDNAGIASSGNYVHVVWGDDRNGNWDIYYLRSEDGGITWSGETPFTALTGTSQYPSITTSGPIVIVNWQDNRDGNYEIYSRRSDDNGLTWGPDVRISSTANVSSRGKLAALGQYVIQAWQEDYGNNNWEINQRFSTDGGLSWSPRQAITNAPDISFQPSPIVGNQRVHVSWFDKRDGNQEIYYSQHPTGNPEFHDNRLSWAYRAGGTSGSNVNAITQDESGWILACGDFQNTVDFDPSANTLNLTSAGVNDVFVTKVDASGQVQWARRIGGPETDVCRSILTDATNNIYLCGSFEGTADFDPGPGVVNLTAGTEADAFLVKLDPQGNLLWAKKMGGNGYDYARSVTLNAAGFVCITGFFSETADFDPGPGVSPLTSNGEEDIFVAQYSISGGYVRAQSFGGTGSDAGRGMVTDANGLHYITGYFSDMVDFDLSLSNAIRTSAGLEDIFVLTLDAGLNFVKCSTVGGTESDRSNTLAIDANRNLIVTGFFNGTADFNPGPMVSNLVSNGLNDGFVLKLNVDGSYAWAQSFGGANEDEGRSLTIDGEGNIFTGGYFSSLADFYPGVPVSQLQSTGGFDAFILKLNASGEFQYLNQLSGTGPESCEAMMAGDRKELFVGGYFSNTLDCDPSADVFKLVATDATDLFLARINTCAATYETIVVTGCDSYTSPDGIVHTESKIYTDTLTNVNGCDSLITVDLTIYHSTETTVTDSACDAYTTPGGNTYTASGTYVEGWTGVNGCDSTVIYQLTIYKSTSHTQVENACDEYIDPTGSALTVSGTYMYTLVNANGCDSLLTLVLQIHHASNATIDIFSCDSLVSPGGETVWYESGSYGEIIPNAAGCDSIITVHLTIGHTATHEENITACQQYTTPDGLLTITESGTYVYAIVGGECDSLITVHATIHEVDTSVELFDASLTSVQAGGQYQWLDCDQGYAVIPGAVDQTFTPDKTGHYAVEVTFEGCTDTSICNQVNIVANHDPTADTMIRLYPNPSDGSIYISSGQEAIIRKIWIEDLQGQVKGIVETGGQNPLTVILPEAEGMYLVRMDTGKGYVIRKMVKIK